MPKRTFQCNWKPNNSFNLILNLIAMLDGGIAALIQEQTHFLDAQMNQIIAQLQLKFSLTSATTT